MAATAMPAAAVAAPVTVDASTVTDAVVDASTEATPTMELKVGAGAAPSTSVAPRFEEQVLQARVLARGVLTAAGGKKADASATLMHPHGALPARLSPPRLHYAVSPRSASGQVCGGWGGSWRA